MLIEYAMDTWTFSMPGLTLAAEKCTLPHIFVPFVIPAFFFRKKGYINFVSKSVRCPSVTFLVNVSPP